MQLLNLNTSAKPSASRSAIWVWSLLGAVAICLVLTLPAARANRTQDNPPSPPAIAATRAPAPRPVVPVAPTAYRVTPPDPTLIPKLAPPTITYAADFVAAPAN
jgi:hypothetical protein